MDIAASTVGFVSLGIQICQTLLSYYDGWKSYNSDIEITYQSIAQLKATFNTLEELLTDVDETKKKHVSDALQACKDSLTKLSHKLEKLQKYGQPQGFQSITAQFQRAWYPFRQSTLTKLQEIVADIQDQLRLSLHVLELDIGLSSAKSLNQIRTGVDKISLQNEQTIQLLQSQAFINAVWWISASDPETNYFSALNRREPTTGTWLLNHSSYLKWKTGADKLLWLHGKAGCGKSVISATIIEDIKAHCEISHAGFGMFYFTFSDVEKQSWHDCLRSLVVQLASKEPATSMLINEHQISRTSASASTLERIFLAEIDSFDQVFIVIDALDESPETEDGNETIRGSLLQELTQLATHPKIKLLCTSRDINDIRKQMESQAIAIPMTVECVNQDIKTYITSQLAKDRKLSKLNAKSKEKIQLALMSKADGMFRWAYCQLQELRKMKSTKPSFIDRILGSLPETLDETYERMLNEIDRSLKNEALIMLKWLAYARRPLSLQELIETTIINLDQNSVDIDDRGDIEDALDILASLVIVVNDVDTGLGEDSDDDGSLQGARIGQILPEMTVRLAHFSVKEYLESERISANINVKEFYLHEGEGHAFLADSCLIYIRYFVDREDFDLEDDASASPLLPYAGSFWNVHSRHREDGNVDQEISFLQSRNAVENWLSMGHHVSSEGFYSGVQGEFTQDGDGFPLYYASIANLLTVTMRLLSLGADANAFGGAYGGALQGVAGKEESEAMISLLLEHGANVNLPGDGGTALYLAAGNAKDDQVRILIENGAEVNFSAAESTVLAAASTGCSESTIKMLIAHGADINERGSDGVTPLQNAAVFGNLPAVELLIAHGADVNAEPGFHGTAMEAAARHNNLQVMKALLENGATAGEV